MDPRMKVKWYLDVVFRRKWWILAILAISVGASPLVFEELPKTYRANITILATPPTLSNQVAESTVVGSVEERVSSLAVQILSRTYLEKVVREFDLVPATAPPQVVEAACEKLKNNVELEHDPEKLSWFRIVAYDTQAKRCAAIANRLADLFIEQNSLWREEQASVAVSTVETWLRDKRKDLQEEEERIAAFKKAHFFELPDQMTTNIQRLNNAQQRWNELTNDIRTREERVAMLTAQLQAQSTDPLSLPAQSLDPAVRKLIELESDLSDLRVRYTDENPAVKQKMAEIEEFKRLHPQVTEDAHADDSKAVGAVGPKGDLARLRKDIGLLHEQRDRAQAEIDLYGDRIEKTPIRQQELLALSRDYDNLKREYDDLLKRKDLASRGQDLELAKRGEQFRIQDPARVPNTPYKPKFVEILLLCIVMGLGAAVGITAVLEFVDQTFRSEDEFRQAFPGIPVLVTIPTLDAGQRHHKKKSRRGRKSVA